MIRRQTSLSKNIVQFCRFLRQKNFMAGVEEETVALNALWYIDYSSNQIFRLALRSVLCRSLHQLQEFDALFDQYWKETEKANDSKLTTKTSPGAKPALNETSFKSLKSWLNTNRTKETEQTASYSFFENLSRKDFSSVPSDQVEELMRTIRALSRRLAARLSRRYERSNKIKLPDLRKTLRLNMRRGGELLEIAFRKPKRNRANLVVLCDVSKSMDLYSAFLLQFMYAFQQVYRSMETFAFGTSLHCITPFLKQHDFTTALDALRVHNESWSGGTRIGESLDNFIRDYASRALNKRTIVIILSDGWDTGDISLLQKRMKEIKARSKKIIWLNPLAGDASYRPAAAGMQAALPFVDVFAPVHNANSLRKLSKWL
ncbi:MAG: VWA domain-containing protein [Chitinophagaceae bacterium]